MVVPLVRQLVHNRRVAVESENNRLVFCKHPVEIFILNSMRMLPRRLQRKQVHHIYKPHLQLRHPHPQHRHRCQRLKCRHVARACNHDVRLVLCIAGPRPLAYACNHMSRRRLNIQEDCRRLLARNGQVDVIARPQHMIRHSQQRVRVRCKINPYRVRMLVRYVVDKSGVLVRKPIVILPPHVRTEQVVQ